jgi:hypothetical protein
MSQTPNTAIAVIGIDIGKNSFHVVGHDARGAIVLSDFRFSPTSRPFPVPAAWLKGRKRTLSRRGQTLAK